MFTLGLFELTLFGLITLMVLGPEKLPVAARAVGRWYAMFRRASQRLQSEINQELQLLEATDAIKKELADLRATEADMKRRMDNLQANLYRQHDVLSRLDSGQLPMTNAGDVQSDKHTAFADLASAEDGEVAEAQRRLATPWQEIAAWQTMPTAPMHYRFFLLSDYDRRRRLPAPPLLPNYQADKLLNTMQR